MLDFLFAHFSPLGWVSMFKWEMFTKLILGISQLIELFNLSKRRWRHLKKDDFIIRLLPAIWGKLTQTDTI